jgi:hypothetical protein
LEDESRHGTFVGAQIRRHEVLDKCCIIYKAESGPSESPVQRGFGWPSLNYHDCARLEEVDEASITCLSYIQGLFTP